uniref:Uncharacterized protein n=1 Tax=Octactis speculum TaxID=3111310 RepID=A0A7S2D1G3_9STRA|mmetsp:Transcript_42390/g.57894  ORF Transcript_42390/g.57894 Transcript_42390/m.57894 type:complete len:490 (+) Transcript_42390:39-1508(+)
MASTACFALNAGCCALSSMCSACKSCVSMCPRSVNKSSFQRGGAILYALVLITGLLGRFALRGSIKLDAWNNGCVEPTDYIPSTLEEFESSISNGADYYGLDSGWLATATDTQKGWNEVKAQWSQEASLEEAVCKGRFAALRVAFVGAVLLLFSVLVESLVPNRKSPSVIVGLFPLLLIGALFVPNAFFATWAAWPLRIGAILFLFAVPIFWLDGGCFLNDILADAASSTESDCLFNCNKYALLVLSLCAGVAVSGILLVVFAFIGTDREACRGSDSMLSIIIAINVLLCAYQLLGPQESNGNLLTSAMTFALSALLGVGGLVASSGESCDPSKHLDLDDGNPWLPALLGTLIATLVSVWAFLGGAARLAGTADASGDYRAFDETELVSKILAGESPSAQDSQHLDTGNSSHGSQTSTACAANTVLCGGVCLMGVALSDNASAEAFTAPATVMCSVAIIASMESLLLYGWLLLSYRFGVLCCPDRDFSY